MQKNVLKCSEKNSPEENWPQTEPGISQGFCFSPLGHLIEFKDTIRSLDGVFRVPCHCCLWLAQLVIFKLINQSIIPLISSTKRGCFSTEKRTLVLLCFD